MTIALGLTLGREMDSTVALAWLTMLRDQHWPGPIYNARSMYTVQARNIVIEQAAADLDAWDSLLFWDADQVPPTGMPAHNDWPGGTFLDYLASRGEPVVGGLYFSRAMPHDPIAYSRHLDEMGRPVYATLTPQELVPMLQKPGVYPVGGVGTGAMLIRQDVITRLSAMKGGRAIFEAPEVEAQPGRQWTEDLYFCEEVRTVLGEEVYLDTAAVSAHRADVWITGQHYLAAHGMISGRPEPASRVLIPGKGFTEQLSRAERRRRE